MPKLNSFRLGIAVMVFIIYVLAANAQAAVIYVPDDYAKIQWAVDNASAGDTIIVRPGTYTENVDIDKSVEIRSYSQNPADTIVKASNSNDHVFYVTADNVYISGFTVTGATDYKDGINLYSSNNCRIENVNISNNYNGIYLSHSSNNIIANNTISSNNRDGICLSYSSSNTIANNTVSSNTRDGIGIYSSSNNNIVASNTVSDNYYGIILFSSSSNTIVNNTISNNKYGIALVSSSNNIIANNTFYLNGMHVEFSYNNTVTNNTVNGEPLVYLENVNDYVVENAGQVIAINSNNITVKNSNLSCASAGIEFFNTNNSKIMNNNISSNNIGIHLRYSSNNIIANNTVSSNNWNGILLDSLSNNNTIVNNTISNNEVGIYLYSSSNNIIANNTVSNNGYGIFLWYSSSNTIYLNNFINTYQVCSDYYSTNIWNSTSQMTYTYGGKTYMNYLGNYWSDYTGSDSDGDGIGDTPYVIKDENIDYYPLMQPFENYQIQEKWSFAIITDLHIGRGYPDYGGPGYDDGDTGQDYYLTERLRKVVEWINDNKSKYNIKFVIVLGDISDSGEYSELKKAKDILDELDVPYVPVIGNHDVLPYTEYEEYDVPFGGYPIGREWFEEIFDDTFENCSEFFENWRKQQVDEPGNPPHLQNYAFSYRGMHFIILDCVASNPFIGPPKGVGSDAVLYKETENWLRERLNEWRGEKVILISHHPLNESITKAFSTNELKDVCEIIKESGCEVVNFAGHIHGSGITRGGDWGHLWHNYFMDANREYVYKDDSTGLLLHSITTEALMVGENSPKEEGVKGIIRIVNVTGKDVHYEPDRANGEFLSLNPFIYLNSAKDMKVGEQIKFTFYPFYSWRWKTLRYTVDWNDGTPIESHTISTSIITGEIREHITHTYTKAGNYIINVTITDTDNPHHIEWITQNIIVKEDAKEPHLLILPEFLLATLWNGADVTENPQNTPEHVIIRVKHSEPIPLADLVIHFENAIEDIDLSNLTADVNLTVRKSVIYMPSWPEEIEESKILYIPSTGKGAVYICKNATSLDEVNLENADVIINVGENKDGMTVLTTYYNGREYYMVPNVTGTGGGEAPSQHPYASFTYSPEYPIVNEKIIFNASSSYDPDGNITKYKWDFGDGNITEVEEPIITHTYSIAGNYTVKLTVTDDKRVKSSISRNITVRPVINQPPIANANGPYTGIEGQTVEFNASLSYDPEGANLTYYWEFGDGNRTVTTQPTITHIYAQEGNYTVTLIVNDSVQNSTPSITYALINDTEPKANFTANVTSGFAPLTVQFNDSSVSYDGIIAWEWDFDGDGIVDSNEQNPIYTYDEAGTYTVSLTVHEADGDSDTETKTDYITVTSAADTEPPTIESVTLDTYINIPNASFHVTVEATDNVGVTSVTADGVALTKTGSRWEGDIFIPEGTPEGEYTLTITAQDEAGNAAESSVNYTVVFPQGGFAVAIDPMMSSASAGDVKVYQIKIISNENFDDKIHVYISDEGIPDAYKANFSFNWTDKTIYLKSGETVELSLEVTIPQASGYKMFRVYADSMRFRTSGYCTGIVLIS